MVTPEIHTEPADDDGHGGVRPEADQEERCILDINIVVYIDQDSESGDGDEDRAKGIQKTMSVPVAQRCDDHAKHERRSPWRNRAQLCLDWVEVVALDDSWREVGVSVRWNDHAEVHETAEPDLVVL